MRWQWLRYGYTPENPAAIENRFPILRKLKVALFTALLVLVAVLFAVVLGTDWIIKH